MKSNIKKPDFGNQQTKINKQLNEPGMVPQAVCPTCYRHLKYPRVESPTVSDGCIRRLYYGWCFECEKGFLTVQFKRGGSWIIEKYKTGVLSAESDRVELDSTWVRVIDPPAAVMTGPGGDYQKEYSPEAVNIVEQIGDYLDHIKDMFEELSKSLRG